MRKSQSMLQWFSICLYKAISDLDPSLQVSPSGRMHWYCWLMRATQGELLIESSWFSTGATTRWGEVDCSYNRRTCLKEWAATRWCKVDSSDFPTGLSQEVNIRSAAQEVENGETTRRRWWIQTRSPLRRCDEEHGPQSSSKSSVNQFWMHGPEEEQERLAQRQKRDRRTWR